MLGANGCEARAFIGWVASVCAHIVGLSLGGSWEYCLAGETLEAVLFCCMMVSVAVGAWKELSGCGRLSGGRGGANILGWRLGGVVD
jgi:hypothetical protein